MENKDIRYIPYGYIPVVSNYENPKNIILSKYAIQIPSNKWKMYSLKMINIDLL